MKTSIANTCAIFKREFKSYFESPVAYVFVVVFLVLLNSLTFLWPTFPFYERGIADLQPFFFWIPIVYLLLVPASTMGLWAEERRSGTIELLLTMPVTLAQAMIGKFLAAWAFITLCVVLTFPIVLTTTFLGNPDVGPIISGYLGAILMAGAYVSVGVLTSAATRSQVISFVVSLAICLLLVLAGTPFITNLFTRWDIAWLINAVASVSLYSNYEAMQRGIIDLQNILFYLGTMVFMLVAAHIIVENRKSA